MLRKKGWQPDHYQCIVGSGYCKVTTAGSKETPERIIIMVYLVFIIMVYSVWQQKDGLIHWINISEIKDIQCESKKVAPLKLFAIFSLGLSIFPWNFDSMLPVYIYTYLTNFGRFVLIFNKMALIFLGVPIIFNFSSFKFYEVKSATLSPIINGCHIHATSIHFIIRLGGNARVLLQTATEAKNSSQV